ncbi:MAG: radical SAM protein [Deltaproteobacteria bacterium]|nr:radical SAM protein [Deltaproteobacteria bacterium]
MSFYRRVFGLIRRNPNMLKTYARVEYRRNIGVELDKRSGSGYSAPPVRLKINLTRLCNLRCQMCIQDRRKDSEQEPYSWNDPKNQLPLAPWIKLLDETAKYHPQVSLTGGEPMMYPHFREIVSAAKERGLVVEMVTNGTLLRRNAEFLVQQGVEIVIVSIDGPEEYHDQIRGQNGSFRLSVEGIRALAEARRRHNSPGPLMGMAFTISRANLDVVEQMIPLAKSLDIDFINYQHTVFDSDENVEKHNRIFTEQWAREQGVEIVAPSVPPGEFYETDIGPQEVALLQRRLDKALNEAGREVVVHFVPDLSRDKIGPYYLDLNHPFSDICKCLWADCRIMPDGSIMPCLHVVAGNITDGPFSEVWNNSKIRSFRKIIGKGLLPGCARCCCRRF